MTHSCQRMIVAVNRPPRSTSHLIESEVVASQDHHHVREKVCPLPTCCTEQHDAWQAPSSHSCSWRQQNCPRVVCVHASHFLNTRQAQTHLTGLDHQIWRLGDCLLSTHVPLSPTTMFRTPCWKRRGANTPHTGIECNKKGCSERPRSEIEVIRNRHRLANNVQGRRTVSFEAPNTAIYS